MALIVTSYEFEKDLTIHKFVGMVTARELSDLIDTQFKTKKVTLNNIWDFRGADVSKLSSDDLLALVKLAKHYENQRPGRKVAHVVTEDLAFGIGRMYTAFTEFEDLDFEVELFRSIEQAKEWLGV